MLEILFLALCLFITVSKWLAGYFISADSAAYINAARSFLEHGTMLVSGFELKDAPIPFGQIPYNTYPIGFPILISGFLLLFKDVVIATMVMQSLVFTLLFYSLRLLLKELGLPLLYRLPVYLFLFASRAYQENFVYFLTEPLFMALNLLLLTLCIQILRAHSRERLNRLLVISVLFLFTTPLIRFNGVFSFIFFIYPIYLKRKYINGRIKTLLALAMVSTVPTMLYFLRNKLVVGTMSSFHGTVGTHINWESMPYLFTVNFHRLFAESYALLFTTVALFIFCFCKMKERDPLALQKKNLLLIAWLISTLSIWMLTVISRSEPLGDRYLCVAYLFFIILFAYLVFRFKVGGLILVVWFLFNAHSFYNPMKNWDLFQVRKPPEQELWKYLDSNPEYKNAEFFVTDYNYSHQIFTSRLQLILERVPDESLDFKEWETYLHAKPRQPTYFYVFRCKSRAHAELKVYLKSKGQTQHYEEHLGQCIYSST